ncbi:hypothetical protein EYF80_043065 [Liparis tanakae]|uniref:Uncharacterized protein n=1 Tax=Liparis tanakae TaxID=230148 RepID=A0A4Z2G1F3_9TELE|nr:hypothetical protein EYF80_043065 [Liparis tanakae]
MSEPARGGCDVSAAARDLPRVGFSQRQLALSGAAVPLQLLLQVISWKTRHCCGRARERARGILLETELDTYSLLMSKLVLLNGEMDEYTLA